MSDPATPAFIANGFNVTAAQRDAGSAVMDGAFSRDDVAAALRGAGVKNLPGQAFTVVRAVDRLLQSARKSGEIRVAPELGRGMWERIT